MQFTEEDKEIIKILLNPETHHLCLFLHKKRASEILEYFNFSYQECIDDFYNYWSWAYTDLLLKPHLRDYLLDSNLLDVSKIPEWNLCALFDDDSLGKRIFHSDIIDWTKLSSLCIYRIIWRWEMFHKSYKSENLKKDLEKFGKARENLEGRHVAGLLTFVTIQEKIFDSNMLNLYSLESKDICEIICFSKISEKIWDSGKFDLSKLDGDHIYWILRDSSIAKKIWDSGKLNLSFLRKDELENFKQKFKD